MPVVLANLINKRSESELIALHDLWIGGTPPTGRTELRRALLRKMCQPTGVASIRETLPANAATVFAMLLKAPQMATPFNEILKLVSVSGIKAGGLRSALAELVAAGLVNPDLTISEGTWQVPQEIFEASKVPALPSLRTPELLTLEAFLQRYFRRSMDSEDAAQKAKRMYAFLADEESICERLGELDHELGGGLSRVISDWGGILSIDDFEKLGFSAMQLDELRVELEENSIGTIADLDLEKFGIRQRGPVLALFNETVFARLQENARENPIKPKDSASIGVDFVSNFSRFASFLGDEDLRFTLRGTIYKSTAKRIGERLIPNPGREFVRRDILELEYRFAVDYQLIERTGSQAYRITKAGNAYLSQALHEKQLVMLDWMVEDMTMPGDMAHQLKLRRTALRYIKGLQPGLWYDAMYLPFLARNHYLAELALENDRLEADSFPVRSSADLQSLAWNLFGWMRKHLYLLGVIDLGYDKNCRACAFKLTQVGVELLEMIPDCELEGLGHIVVNPDFEVVLFPDERSHELVYQLDCFCERELSDSLIHYRLTPGSLHRGLSQGMNLKNVIDLLTERSKTPLPQNVLFSLESWARAGGQVVWHRDGRLVCDSPEILDRLELHPQLAQLGIERVAEDILQLTASIEKERLGAWMRDFGVSLKVAS